MTPEQRKRLETNERAFHFWSDEDKAAARKIGKDRFLLLGDHGWRAPEYISTTFYASNVYRLNPDYKPQPAITGWPEGLNKRFKWFVKAKLGGIYVFEKMPNVTPAAALGWYNGGECYRISGLFPDIQCHTDWQDSLTERTE